MYHALLIYPINLISTELFLVENHKIPASSILGRALPPTPKPVQEEGPYVMFQQVPDISPTTSISLTTAVNLNTSMENQRLEDAPYAHPMSEGSPTSAGSNYSTDDEDIYEEIKCPTNHLRHISHGRHW